MPATYPPLGRMPFSEEAGDRATVELGALQLARKKSGPQADAQASEEAERRATGNSGMTRCFGGGSRAGRPAGNDFARRLSVKASGPCEGWAFPRIPPPTHYVDRPYPPVFFRLKERRNLGSHRHGRSAASRTSISSNLPTLRTITRSQTVDPDFSAIRHRTLALKPSKAFLSSNPGPLIYRTSQ